MRFFETQCSFCQDVLWSVHLSVCHMLVCVKMTQAKITRSSLTVGVDPSMGRPGASPHWPKVGAGHGCMKQSASDTVASCHLNTYFCPSFVWSWTKGFQLQSALPPNLNQGPLNPAWGLPQIPLWVLAARCPWSISFGKSWMCPWCINPRTPVFGWYCSSRNLKGSPQVKALNERGQERPLFLCLQDGSK